MLERRYARVMVIAAGAGASVHARGMHPLPAARLHVSLAVRDEQPLSLRRNRPNGERSCPELAGTANELMTEG